MHLIAKDSLIDQIFEIMSLKRARNLMYSTQLWRPSMAFLTQSIDRFSKIYFLHSLLVTVFVLLIFGCDNDNESLIKKYKQYYQGKAHPSLGLDEFDRKSLQRLEQANPKIAYVYLGSRKLYTREGKKMVPIVWAGKDPDPNDVTIHLINGKSIKAKIPDAYRKEIKASFIKNEPQWASINIEGIESSDEILEVTLAKIDNTSAPSTSPTAPPLPPEDPKKP